MCPRFRDRTRLRRRVERRERHLSRSTLQLVCFTVRDLFAYDLILDISTSQRHGLLLTHNDPKDQSIIDESDYRELTTRTEVDSRLEDRQHIQESGPVSSSPTPPS